MLPLAWGFLSALKPSTEIFSYPPRFFPRPALRPLRWNWIVYSEVFSDTNFLRYFWNTFLLGACCWITSLLPSSLAGYALAKLKTPGKSFLLLLFFATLMVPFQAYLVPLFLTVRRLPLVHLNLTSMFAGYLAIILPAGVSAFNIFLFKSFFEDLPDALIEAARLDGSSEIGILYRVVLPLSYSVFAVVSIFSFVSTWNDFLWPYLVINDNSWQTIMLKLYDYEMQGDISKNKVLAALMIASLPPIALFAMFQKRIMQGIAMTGIKF
jgi:ABC-type glycerol-3-phosphate transport system permease component